MRTHGPALAGALMLLSPSATAQVIAEHNGNADPALEGWNLVTMGTSSVGGLTGDLGFDAWQVASTNFARYQTGDLDAGTKADALARGWKITLFARVGAAPDGRGLVTSNLENLNGRRFDINLGLDGNGDTFVRLNTNIVTTPQLVGVGPTFTLTGQGSGYHLYELVFDPGSQSADLFVDGVERISDYAGHTNFVRPFGYYFSCYQNHTGNYNLARFEVLPAVASIPAMHPGALAALTVLLLLSGSVVLARRRVAARSTPHALWITALGAFAQGASTPPAHAQVWEECNIRNSYLGEATGDSYGWVGLNAGDVDGDGKDDVIVGAPGNSGGAGRAYVYSSATGLELFRFTGFAGERVGFAVGAAGNVNGDAFADVIVGAPGGAGAPGKAYVLLGPNGAPGPVLTGLSNGDSFGSSVGCVGDATGDGIVDWVVGASTDGTSGGNSGKAYVLSGASRDEVHSVLGEAAGDRFGSSVAGLGDRDGDGFGDWIVGAPSAGPMSRGRAYVYTGIDGSLVTSLTGDATSANYGQFFVGPCGDIDGNGDADFFVSDFNNSALGPGTGRAFVYSGTDLSLLLTLTGEAGGHGFGIGRGWLGDWDGDGKDDLFFGSWTQGASNTGRGEVRSGVDGRILARFTGDTPGATLGFDAAGLGDVDGDGVPDVVLTAASQAGNRGATLVLSGAPRPPANFCQSAPNSASAGASMRYRLSTSLAGNELRIRATGAPPGKAGLFFYGANEVSSPFGDGTRCVGSPTFRLYPIVQVGGNGVAVHTMDFTQGNPAAGPGQITPGSTWSFQFWFRDPGGPGGAGFNLSARAFWSYRSTHPV